MMSNADRELGEKVPIWVSVQQLDEQFPWLANLCWNTKEDEERKVKHEESK